MMLTQDIRDMRAKRKAQIRNNKAAQAVVEFRDGYAAAFADYTAFRDPLDGIEELAALNEKHVAGYRLGYKEASRGVSNRWPRHPAPQRFGFAA